VELLPLDQLLSRADIVSIHVPLLPTTTKLVDQRFIRQMKDGAFLVNVARGDVVDEEALAEGLRSKLAGAALDVRVHEPPLTGPLDQLPNVVYTSHIGGLTHAAQARVLDLLAKDIEEVLNGGEAAHAVGKVKRARAGAARAPSA
jgi:D-3-phosphoglycerate dehydrogenase